MVEAIGLAVVMGLLSTLAILCVVWITRRATRLREAAAARRASARALSEAAQQREDERQLIESLSRRRSSEESDRTP